MPDAIDLMGLVAAHVAALEITGLTVEASLIAPNLDTKELTNPVMYIAPAAKTAAIDGDDSDLETYQMALMYCRKIKDEAEARAALSQVENTIGRSLLRAYFGDNREFCCTDLSFDPLMDFDQWRNKCLCSVLYLTLTGMQRDD